MAKNKISEYSATAASNTDVANINIAEGCSPSNVNNAIRGVMAHLKDFQAGNVTGNALAIAGGGTGAESASAARTNLSAAASGANSDITSLSGLTTPLSVAQGGSGAATLTGYLKGNGTSAFTAQTTPIPVADGGTGATTLTANNVILGNGTSAPTFVAPGTSGNVLTSNGTTWASAAPTLGIGDGQTWQAVTRAFNTNYTNSTGRPIMLAGSFDRNSSSTANVDIIIDSVQVPLARNTNSGGGNGSAGSIIIPTGAVYQLVNISEPLSSYNIFELR